MDDIENVIPFEGEETTSARTPIAIYRHKNVRRFAVGPFEFNDFLLKVYDADEDAQFVELYKGLHASDKGSIVRLKSVELEAPVLTRRTIVGEAASTDFIIDQTAPVKANPNAGGLSGLLGGRASR